MRPQPTKDEQYIFDQLWDPLIRNDVRKWVQLCWPWGEPNTPLHDRPEPNRWQIAFFEEVTDFLRRQTVAQLVGDDLEVLQYATSSGRGIGKTAADMMLGYWFMSTVCGGTCIVTANSESQLKEKTWGELGVWHAMAVNAHWFDRATLSLTPAPWFKDKIVEQLKIDPAYYYMAGMLWDKDRPEAFAGNHNRYGLFVNFQEAIGIPKPVWNVSKGFFTDKTTHRIFGATSNPRKNTGAFFECFHKNRNQWSTRMIDSRSVEHVDVKLCNKIIEEHGEDSSEACAEVTGKFPGESETQYIPRSLIRQAMKREAPTTYDHGAPTVIGVDVARQGGDRSSIFTRKGRDGRTWPPIVLKKAKNDVVAGRVRDRFEELRAAGYRPIVNVDIGAGTGVVDILAMWGIKANEIDFGSAADESDKYKNKRAEMYGRAKHWLKGGYLVENAELEDDLAGPEYRYSDGGDGQQVVLESKDDMRDRGLASPDVGDSFVLTLAQTLAREDLYDHFSAKTGAPQLQRIAAGVGDDWNPFDN